MKRQKTDLESRRLLIETKFRSSHRKDPKGIFARGKRPRFRRNRVKAEWDREAELQALRAWKESEALRERKLNTDGNRYAEWHSEGHLPRTAPEPKAQEALNKAAIARGNRDSIEDAIERARHRKASGSLYNFKQLR